MNPDLSFSGDTRADDYARRGHYTALCCFGGAAALV
jgi:hypothetical protein